MLLINKFLLSFIVILLLASIGANIFLFSTLLSQNTAVKVPDGDSIDLADGRRIRLLGIDAPEKERCMYEEAKYRLRAIVEGKRLRLKNRVTDDFGRMLANVFVGDVFVNKVMLEEGLARFSYVKSDYYDELKQAFIDAKEQKRGIYSERCRTTTPSADCNIKGNIRGKDMVYHLPTCDNYEQVIIDEAFGDRWFCSEDEAMKEGFRKAQGCD